MTLFDPGLQPERTELAWRRTTLSVGVGSLVALRLFPATLGSPWWLFLGIGGLLFSAALWVLGARRARAVDAALTPTQPLVRSARPGGLLLAALAGFALLAALAGLVIVLVAAMR